MVSTSTACAIRHPCLGFWIWALVPPNPGGLSNRPVLGCSAFGGLLAKFRLFPGQSSTTCDVFGLACQTHHIASSSLPPRHHHHRTSPTSVPCLSSTWSRSTTSSARRLPRTTSVTPIEASPPALPKSPDPALELRFFGAGQHWLTLWVLQLAMGVLGTLFGGSFAMLGGGSTKTPATPAINASSSDEADFIKCAHPHHSALGLMFV